VSSRHLQGVLLSGGGLPGGLDLRERRGELRHARGVRAVIGAAASWRSGSMDLYRRPNHQDRLATHASRHASKATIAGSESGPSSLTKSSSRVSVRCFASSPASRNSKGALPHSRTRPNAAGGRILEGVAATYVLSEGMRRALSVRNSGFSGPRWVGRHTGALRSSGSVRGLRVLVASGGWPS
jgi:hypothetical protein